MTLLNEFWQLDFGNVGDLALVDPVVGPRTYGDLRADVAKAALLLDSHARTLGTDRLLIALEMSARTPVIAHYLAALCAGHVILLGAPDSFQGGNRFCETYSPNLIIKMAANHCTLMPASDRPVALHSDLRLLLSTSGTTGDPKLVRLSGENLSSNAVAISDYLGLRADDRAVTTLPLHYVFGLSVLHAHLQVGAAVVLTDMSVTDLGFAPLFLASGGTNISVVPHQVDLLLASGFQPDSLSGLRHIAQAGGKLAPAKVREMARFGRQGGWSFFVMYGQTEASPRMAYLPPDMAETHADSVGRPIQGGSFTIRGEDGAPITRHDIPGDLIYSGPNVMMGYAQSQHDLALAKDTFELITGDVAELSDDGLIKIVGRRARFAKLFGLRISLDQVESLLRNSGTEGYAVAVDDQLVLMLPKSEDEDSARGLVAKAYGLPKGAINAAHLETVPVLQSGKVDMKSITDLARTALLSRGVTKIQGETLASVMAEATRNGSVPLDESYTSLGGDSLGYLSVQMFLDRHLGAAPIGWENMTLRQLQELSPDREKQNSFWSNLDMDLALRVTAIICVILVHLGRLPVGGGTWVLVLLMGYSFARFQRPRLLAGNFQSVLVRMLHPILLLYGLLLVAFQVLEDELPLGYVLLLGNSIGPGPGSVLTVLWFVSLYTQLVLVLVLMFRFAPFRRSQRAQPWLSSTIAFGIATCGAAVVLWLSPDPFAGDHFIGILGSPIAVRSPIICLPIVLLGMMIYSAQSRFQSRMAALGLAIACIIFPATAPSQPFMLGAAGVLLICFRSVRLPAVLARLISGMAATTLFVYLLHNIVVHVVRTATPIKDIIGLPASVALVVPASFIVGYVAKTGFDKVDRWVSVWWRKRSTAEPVID